MTTVPDTLRRIVSDPLTTADLWAPTVVPLVALVLLLATRHYLGRWPDLWRVRRAVLPIVDRLADGDLDKELDVIDEHVGVDLEAATDALPEKTGMPLQAREFAGTIDAPPSQVRAELRSMPRVYPATLASIQYEIVDGSRVWEVGSYVFRPRGFLGKWQYHIRLTPADGGRQTRLWPHFERSALRFPVRHYDAAGWDADEGVHWVASLYASDGRYAPSDRAVELVSGAV